MDSSYIPYLFLDCLACTGSLVGSGVGIFLLTRRQTTAGILALIGFLLLSVNPVMQFLLYGPLLLTGTMDFELVGWLDACITGGALLTGCILIGAALVMAIRPAVDEAGPEALR
jgi:hypothetical protein